MRTSTPTNPPGPVLLLGSLAAIAGAAAVATPWTPLAGGALTLVATALAAWWLMRAPVEVYLVGPSLSELTGQHGRREKLRQRARWFVHMRWVAVVVSFGLILVAVPVSGLLPAAALALMAGWWAVLVAANVVFSWWVGARSGFENQITVQGLVDLVVLTGFLNASGGVENPVYFAYLFHVIIAGILLPRRKAFALTAAAAALFLVMAWGEYLHVLPHFTNRLFPHEGQVASGHDHPAETAAVASGGEAHESGVTHAAHGAVFVLGRTLPLLTLLMLSAYLTSLIAERLRRREAQLEEAGETLMLEHQRLERVVDSAGVGMMLVSPELTVPWTTERAARWLGRLRGGSDAALCPLYQVPDGCPVCIAESTLGSGRPEQSERTARTADGVRYYRHATSPVLDAEGETIQVVELIEDVTDRKALEAEALHAGKLTALGQMAAGVAHEIGNPLSSLATRLELLERRPEPDYVRDSVHLLRTQIERIRRIVHGISLFARSRKQEFSVWCINDVVAETLEIARLDRRVQQVSLETRLARRSPTVRGVKDQMTQVLLNLVLNAAEASPRGSEVMIETAERNGVVQLSVSDQGAGISAAGRGRLFEPFFSTKPRGTGLGLSICYSLVNAHGGTIDVASEEGHGSTFTVALPLAGEPATRTESA